MKTKTQVVVGAISLLTMLMYTLIHTGGLLAHYISPTWAGYVAAFGIEAAVVSLSLRIGELRKSKQSPRFFLFVLISVVFISALANVAEGFAARTGEPLTVQSVQELDVVQAIVGLSATGLISLVVLAMSEVVGTDVQVAVKEHQRAEQRTTKDEASSEPSSPELQQSCHEPTPSSPEPSVVSVSSKSEALNVLLNFVASNPKATLSEAGRIIGRSKSTVSSYLDELEKAGIIKRNGNGIEVLKKQEV